MVQPETLRVESDRWQKQALENPYWEVTGREVARQGMLLSQVPKPSEHAPLPLWNSLPKTKFKDNINDFKTLTSGPFGAHSPMWLFWLYTHEVNPDQCAAQAKYQRKQEFSAMRFLPRIKWSSGKCEARGRVEWGGANQHFWSQGYSLTSPRQKSSYSETVMGRWWGWASSQMSADLVTLLPTGLNISWVWS